MEAWWVFPLVGGIIGWFTNFLAVKMIFRPRSPILGMQGLIPRRRRDLALSIGETVSTHLVNQEDIMKALPLDDIKEKFEGHVGLRIDQFIDKKLIAANPMLAAFISDDLKKKIRDGVIEEMSDLLPQMEKDLFGSLEGNFDMKSIVVEKIENFDVQKLEEIILSIAKKELKAIEILGGVIGALVGFVQYILVSQNFITIS